MCLVRRKDKIREMLMIHNLKYNSKIYLKTNNIFYTIHSYKHIPFESLNQPKRRSHRGAIARSKPATRVAKERGKSQKEKEKKGGKKIKKENTYLNDIESEKRIGGQRDETKGVGNYP